jgi:hypothetical protein
MGITFITPCDEHKGADKNVQKKCPNCKVELVTFI